LRSSAIPISNLDAAYLKVRWGASVATPTLLACVGVDEEAFMGGLGGGGDRLREGGDLRLAAAERHRGLNGVRLVVSDDHEGIKTSVAGEFPAPSGTAAQSLVVWGLDCLGRSLQHLIDTFTALHDR
jgi:transposase-like protein